MQHLNWLDYAIILIVALSAIISLMRGFIREALSLAAWIIAFWVSFTFSNKFSGLLQPYIHSNSVRFIAAFLILFIVVLIIGSIINSIITRIVDKTGLSGTDRLFGVVFGLGRGVLLVAIILIALQLTSLPHQTVWAQSRLIPQFQPIETWLEQYIPKDLQNNLDAKQSLPTKTDVNQPAKVKPVVHDSVKSDNVRN